MKNTYLAVVAFTLLVMGTVYTFVPTQYMAGANSPINDPRLLTAFRGFGGFYLGFAAFLVIAQWKSNLMDGAVISVVLVMIGLLTGRAVGLIIEGKPGTKIWVSLAMELIFAVWGLIILGRSYRNAGFDSRLGINN
jgi:hypothetical protein